jgi:hypothetical protein
MTDLEIEKTQIEYAESQFVGFFHAKKGFDIKSLCESMGLTKKEWDKIRRTMGSYFSPSDCEEIDAIFNEKKETP